LPVTFFETKKLQSAFSDFCSIEGWNSPLAVTLTLKQGRKIATVAGAQWNAKAAWTSEVTQFIDGQTCTANFRHFSNLLNRAVYGHAAKRYGKKVRMVVVLEGNAAVRWHFHAAIDCAAHIEPDGFADLVRECWAQTDWAYGEADIQTGADDGWIRYMSKLRTKTDLASSIDWTNTHLT
jgi:hypothetical protein